MKIKALVKKAIITFMAGAMLITGSLSLGSTQVRADGLTDKYTTKTGAFYNDAMDGLKAYMSLEDSLGEYDARGNLTGVYFTYNGNEYKYYYTNPYYTSTPTDKAHWYLRDEAINYINNNMVEDVTITRHYVHSDYMASDGWAPVYQVNGRIHKCQTYLIKFD